MPTKSWLTASGVVMLFTVLIACSGTTTSLRVDGSRLTAADKEPGNWLTHGRTYTEQRFSPLARITTANVGNLGLAWWHDIKSRTARGLEATPIVVDGVIYTSGAWSHVVALEAKTGKVLWEFDPQVPGAYAGKGCCDVVNRGVAVWGGKVFVGTYDGRLIALERRLRPEGVGRPHRRPVSRLHDHRRPASGEGQGHHRQRGRRVRCPRVRLGL